MAFGTPLNSKHPRLVRRSFEPCPYLEAAAIALRDARKLPVGPERNELRQIAIGMRWLAKLARQLDDSA